MAQTTRSQFPNTVYTAAWADGGPLMLEPMEQGTWRVHVGASAPTTGTDAYHLLKYPGGVFSYSGTEKVYVQSDSSDSSTSYIAITTLD